MVDPCPGATAATLKGTGGRLTEEVADAGEA